MSKKVGFLPKIEVLIFFVRIHFNEDLSARSALKTSPERATRAKRARPGHAPPEGERAIRARLTRDDDSRWAPTSFDVRCDA